MDDKAREEFKKAYDELCKEHGMNIIAVPEFGYSQDTNIYNGFKIMQYIVEAK